MLNELGNYNVQSNLLELLYIKWRKPFSLYEFISYYILMWLNLKIINKLLGFYQRKGNSIIGGIKWAGGDEWEEKMFSVSLCGLRYEVWILGRTGSICWLKLFQVRFRSNEIIHLISFDSRSFPWLTYSWEAIVIKKKNSFSASDR